MRKKGSKNAAKQQANASKCSIPSNCATSGRNSLKTVNDEVQKQKENENEKSDICSASKEMPQNNLENKSIACSSSNALQQPDTNDFKENLPDENISENLHNLMNSFENLWEGTNVAEVLKNIENCRTLVSALSAEKNNPTPNKKSNSKSRKSKSIEPHTTPEASSSAPVESQGTSNNKQLPVVYSNIVKKSYKIAKKSASRNHSWSCDSRIPLDLSDKVSKNNIHVEHVLSSTVFKNYAKETDSSPNLGQTPQPASTKLSHPHSQAAHLAKKFPQTVISPLVLPSGAAFPTGVYITVKSLDASSTIKLTICATRNWKWRWNIGTPVPDDAVLAQYGVHDPVVTPLHDPVDATGLPLMGYIIKMYPRVYKELRDCVESRIVILRAVFRLLFRMYSLEIDASNIEIYINDACWQHNNTCRDSSKSDIKNTHPESGCMLDSKTCFKEDEEVNDVECQPPEKPQYSVEVKRYCGIPMCVILEINVPMMDTGHLLQFFTDAHRIVLTDVCDVYYMSVTFPFELETDPNRIFGRFLSKKRIVRIICPCSWPNINMNEKIEGGEMLYILQQVNAQLDMDARKDLKNRQSKKNDNTMKTNNRSSRRNKNKKKNKKILTEPSHSFPKVTSSRVTVPKASADGDEYYAQCEEFPLFAQDKITTNFTSVKNKEKEMLDSIGRTKRNKLAATLTSVKKCEDIKVGKKAQNSNTKRFSKEMYGDAAAFSALRNVPPPFFEYLMTKFGSVDDWPENFRDLLFPNGVNL